jgi:hypothetical protein
VPGEHEGRESLGRVGCGDSRRAVLRVYSCDFNIIHRLVMIGAR